MRRITNLCLPAPLSSKDKQKPSTILLDEEETIIGIDDLAGNQSFNNSQSWNGDFLSPMGLDIQINGGLGLSFSDIHSISLEKISELQYHLWEDGIEAICPTIISCNLNSLRSGLSVLRQARLIKDSNKCEILGAHLEGPFLKDIRKGAHPEEHLSIPNLQSLEARINGFENEIALMTIAPEISGAFAVIERLNELGVKTSIGHSEADDVIAKNAFKQGVSMLTHTFNAMPPLLHRSPGPIGEALINGNVFIGLIADGIHVHPTMAVLLQRLAKDQMFLVSDAISAYGLGDGVYKWDERKVTVDNFSCHLEDGTLAGSTLPLLEAVKKLAKWSAEPSASIWSATVSPRLALGHFEDLNEYLLGKPLKKLLRWRMNEADNELFWEHAS